MREDLRYDWLYTRTCEKLDLRRQVVWCARVKLYDDQAVVGPGDEALYSDDEKLFYSCSTHTVTN